MFHFSPTHMSEMDTFRFRVAFSCIMFVSQSTLKLLNIFSALFSAAFVSQKIKFCDNGFISTSFIY